MYRRSFPMVIGFTFVSLVVAALLLVACEREGPAERAGKDIDRAAKDAGKAVERAGEKIQDATKK